MANKISYLTNENGEKISPVVNINSIYADNGKTLLDYLHPVGSIYISTTSTNPGTIFGGTWVQWGAGRVPIGINTSDTNFNTVEKTGGSKTHTITASEMPSHSHSIPALSGTAASAGSHSHRLKRANAGQTDFSTLGEFTNRTSGKEPLQQAGNYTWDVISPTTTSAGAHTHTVSTTASTTGNKGSGTAMNILQPYIVCYMWKRTQ